MEILKSTWFCLLIVFYSLSSLAQDSLKAVPVPPQKAIADSVSGPARIAIFAPLYLDSAFDANNEFRYGKQLPKFFNPGLDFWEGAEMAIDTMQKEGAELEIHVYDTRSAAENLTQILQRPEMKEMNLLIGHVSGPEAHMLADVAARQGITFINANYPNDAGVSNNPNYIILNSTLLTHCAGLYKFMQKNFALSPIVLFTKKGIQEDRLRSYIDSAAAATLSVPLKITTVVLNDNFTAADIASHLDSSTTSICVAGSLDVGFGQQFTQLLASMSASYSTIIVGMPTWELIDFNRPAYKGTEIIYSTPFYYNPTDKWVAGVNDYFRKTYFTRPSDMVFRGYETVYHFAHLTLDQLKGTALSIQDKKYRLFSDLDIQPVLSKPGFTLEYFENKKLYFVKKVDGVVKAVY